MSDTIKIGVAGWSKGTRSTDQHLSRAKAYLYKLRGDAMREKRKTKQIEPGAERKAILNERETLKRPFPAAYSPDIGVFSDGKVEVMFKLTISQAQALANLLKEHKL